MFVFLITPPAAVVDTGAASREYVADPVRRCRQKSVPECHYVGQTRRATEIFSDSVIRPTGATAAERRSNGSPLPTNLRDMPANKYTMITRAVMNESAIITVQK